MAGTDSSLVRHPPSLERRAGSEAMKRRIGSECQLQVAVSMREPQAALTAEAVHATSPAGPSVGQIGVHLRPIY